MGIRLLESMGLINLTEEFPIYGNNIPGEGCLREKGSGLVVANRIGTVLAEKVGKEKALEL